MDLTFPKLLPLYLAGDVRCMDQATIKGPGVSGIDLMERAGKSAFELIRQIRPEATTLSAVAGQGNNGGDAYIVARLAIEAGWDVSVYPSIASPRSTGDAGLALERFKAAGGRVLDFIPEDFEGAEVLVDGLFGTGLNREVDGSDAAIIGAVNRYKARGLSQPINRRTVLALDLPSGLDADSGRLHGCAVEADHTLTFLVAKPGLFTGMGPSRAGQVHLADLGMESELRRAYVPRAFLMEWPPRKPLPRGRETHKGHFGHVLIIGGSPGFSGAAMLAGEAAARVGAGLVSIGTHPNIAGSIGQNRAELMVHGISEKQDLTRLMEKASVIAIGPGLGTSQWARTLLEEALEATCPLVLDADALKLLADMPKQQKNWVLTPHPGEAALMLGVDSRTVQNDRYDAISQLLKDFGGTCVLKGSGTLIGTSGEPLRVGSTGNPGMASGGMGDVLTGVIAGLIAQGMSPSEAAASGVMLHGAAADLAVQADGERGLIASDLFPCLRKLINYPNLLQCQMPCVIL